MPNQFRDTIPLVRVVAVVVRPLWKTIAVGMLFVLAFIAWCHGIMLFLLTTALAVVARSIEPEIEPPGADGIAKTRYGNCWSFALPRWYDQDGGLYIRWSVDILLFRVFRIPHVAWIRELPSEGLVIEQFDPVKRTRSKWFPWQAVWYEGRIKRTEARHDAVMTTQEKIDSGVMPLDEEPPQ